MAKTASRTIEEDAVTHPHRRRWLVATGTAAIATALGVRQWSDSQHHRGSRGLLAELPPSDVVLAAGDQVARGALRLPLLTGGEVDLVEFAGQPLILSFWASWCAPCLSELRMLRDEATRLRHAGIGLVTVVNADLKVTLFASCAPSEY